MELSTGSISMTVISRVTNIVVNRVINVINRVIHGSHLQESPQGVTHREDLQDDIKHPKHYTQGAIEPIVFIQDQKLDYMEGNVVKYVVRYKYKGTPLKDLLKAKVYLEWLIARETNTPLQKTKGGVL
jgi:hypothetical protein